VIGREHERAITYFEAVQTHRVCLIEANDLTQVCPVQAVVRGLGQTESRVKRVIGKFRVVDDEQIARAGHLRRYAKYRAATHVAIAGVIRINGRIGIWRDAYVLGIARAEWVRERAERGDDGSRLVVAHPLTPPHLPCVRATIAGEKLIAIFGFEHAHGRIGPGETVISVGDRRLRTLTSVVALLQ